MFVIYASHPKKGKLRKVFWNEGDAKDFCRELIEQGYQPEGDAANLLLTASERVRALRLATL